MGYLRTFALAFSARQDDDEYMPRRPAAQPARRERGTGMIAADRGGYRAKISFGEEIYRKRFGTYEEADEWLLSLVRAHRGGRAVSEAATTQHTVRTWMRQWLGETAGTRDMDTNNDYDRTAGVWIYPHLGNIPLRNLDSTNILSWRTWLSETPSSQLRRREDGTAYYPPLSIQRQIFTWRVLSKALKTAVSRGLIVSHPMGDVSAPSMRNAAQTDVRELALTDADLSKLLGFLSEHACTENNHNVCALRWRLGVELGLRQGEVLALNWDSVTLTGSSPNLIVRRHLKRIPWEHGAECSDDSHRAASCPEKVDGGLQIFPGTKAGRQNTRRIPLTPSLVQAFQEHKKITGKNSGHVFLNRVGSLVNPRADSRDWDSVRDSAGILTHYKLHSLRHTTASRLAEQNIAAAQAILGHASIQTTSSYVHASHESLSGVLGTLSTSYEELTTR